MHFGRILDGCASWFARLVKSGRFQLRIYPVPVLSSIIDVQVVHQSEVGGRWYPILAVDVESPDGRFAGDML